MRFLADMGVDIRVVEWLRREGHDAVHLREALARDRPARVILFRLTSARAPHVIERLASVLEASADALERGAIVLVEDARHRIRLLPIGKSPRQ